MNCRRMVVQLSISNCQNRLSLLQLASITVVIGVNYFAFRVNSFVLTTSVSS